MGGLAFAMRDLPVGTAYAVWVGIGALLTVAYAMVTGQEPASVLRLLFVALIIAGVGGLKLHALPYAAKASSPRPHSGWPRRPGSERSGVEGRR